MHVASRRGGLVLALSALCLLSADTDPRRPARSKKVRAEGHIEAIQRVKVFSQVSGYASERCVDLGDRVVKGDLLATIEVPALDVALLKSKAELKAAQARVMTAKAIVEVSKQRLLVVEQQVRTAQATYKRREAVCARCEAAYKRLANPKTDADREALRNAEDALEDARLAQRAASNALAGEKGKVAHSHAELQRDEAAVEEARHHVMSAQAEVKLAQTRVEESKIHSRFTGIISERRCFPGDFVCSGDSSSPSHLMTIECLERVRVILQAPESHFHALHPGLPANIQVAAIRGKDLLGKVSRIGLGVDRDTKTCRVEIDLDNPGELLRDGMSASAVIELDEGEKKEGS